MGFVVRVVSGGDTVVRPAGCDSVRKFLRGYFRRRAKEEGRLSQG